MEVKNWIALGVSILAIVAEITLIFLNPVAAIFSGVGFVLGAVAGYFLKKKEVVTVEKIVEKVVYKDKPKKKVIPTTK